MADKLLLEKTVHKKSKITMIVLDLETTGLDRNHSQIINLGAVHLESGDELYLECYPDRSKGLDNAFDDFTTNIHGVTRARWYDRSEYGGHYLGQKQTVDIFIEFCLDQEPTPLLAGKNIGSFDCMIAHRSWDGTFSMKWPLGHRFLEIASLAYGIYGKMLSSHELADLAGEIREQEIHTGISGARHEAAILRKLLELSNWPVINE
jgi:DNA polymerase III epsilon subunit-like protein